MGPRLLLPTAHCSIRRAALAISAAAVALGVGACGSAPPPPPRTTPVELASVSTGVDATGSVSSLGSTNLGFPTGGQLTSVRVKVGDAVHAGQVLATIDDFAARRALQQARAQLAGQQAQYDKVADTPSVQSAQNSVNAAASVVSATKRQVDATLAGDDAAVSAAQAGGAGTAGTSTAGAGAAGAMGTMGAGGAMGTEGASGGGTTLGGAVGAATGAAAAGGMTALGMTGSTAGGSAASAATSVAQAEAKRQADAAAGDVQIANARQGQVTAQNNLDAASATRPDDLAAARAAVDAARAQVQTAQQNLTNTTLRAPTDGTITALNGAEGEFVAASGSTTPVAPGTDAAIPGAAQAANSAAGAAAGAASPTRPGGTQFMVLQNLGGFAVVVPFQEVDAAKIAPQQHVDVAVDAIPDGPLTGTVLAVAPSATALSGSIEYYVTVGLPPDPRLHDGQSARATVITAESGQKLSVPNTALHRQGATTTVTVVTRDGRLVPTPVTTGIVGTDRTEITGGLAQGQQVVLGGGS
jgi:HlyD family secretion protein